MPVDADAAATEVDPAGRLAAAFVLSCRTDNTRRAYARDIRAPQLRLLLGAGRIRMRRLMVEKPAINAAVAPS